MWSAASEEIRTRTVLGVSSLSTVPLSEYHRVPPIPGAQVSRPEFVPFDGVQRSASRPMQRTQGSNFHPFSATVALWKHLLGRSSGHLVIESHSSQWGTHHRNGPMCNSSTKDISLTRLTGASTVVCHTAGH